MKKAISIILPIVLTILVLSCENKNDDTTDQTKVKNDFESPQNINSENEKKEVQNPCKGNYFRKGMGTAKYFIENLPESQGRVWVKGEKHTFELTPGTTDENYRCLKNVEAWAKDNNGNALNCASASDGGDGITIVCFGCGGDNKVILKFSKIGDNDCFDY